MMERIEIDTPYCMSLDAVANSGQCFRWAKIYTEKKTSAYSVPIYDSTYILRQTDSKIIIESKQIDIVAIERYLSLRTDYRMILEELLALDSTTAKAIKANIGLRILQQPFFETAISFILSQNNSIINIRNSLNKILSYDNSALSSPETLLAVLSRDACSTGYRKEYLIGFCEEYLQGTFEEIEHEHVSYSDTLETLLAVRGIGPKVANCICLFSLGYFQALPKDTWIKKLEKEYHIVWHPKFAGIQQQFLFEWFRNQ